MGEIATYKAGKAIGAVDKILLRGASSGKSPEELSALTGGVIKPAKAAQRVRDILSSRDWLSILEKKQLLVDDMMALKDVLYEKAVTYEEGGAAGDLIKVLTTMQRMLSEEKVDLTEAMTQIRKAHAQMMIAAIRIALERSMLELEKRYPDVPGSELVEIFQLALPEAVAEVESRVKDEE